MRVNHDKLVIEAREERGAARAALEQQCWSECGARCARDMGPGTDTHACVLSCGQGRCPLVRFTSGRVRTYGKFSVAPTARHKTIRVEARMSVPSGTGMWPSFWMLPDRGANEKCTGCGVYGPWPASGEIDVMEAVNGGDRVHGSLHFGGPFQASRTASEPLGPGFHVFAIEWEQQEIRWYVDGRLYQTAQSKAAAPDGWWSGGGGVTATSPFDVPFYLIINLAVGGTLTGSPSPDAISASLAEGRRRLVVDYVRVLGR